MEAEVPENARIRLGERWIVVGLPTLRVGACAYQNCLQTRYT